MQKTFSLVLSTSALFIVWWMLLLPDLQAQSCSSQELTAKYWQYRKNLKHFVAIDRDEQNGCVNDGIGQDPNNPCVCSKNGYSLPATSIDQEPSGDFGVREERKKEGGVWLDRDCEDDDGDPNTNGVKKTHNYLDVGSETPHMMGAYWTMLATEYKLLKDQGQAAEAQRTLEELFLALQAYRRLDIVANCMVRDRYQEISDNFEVDRSCGSVIRVNAFGIPIAIIDNTKACLCGDKYRNQPSGSCQMKHFDAPCNGYPVCQFVPRTDGFSGFFIREDATQKLEGLLHDESEDKWNIDFVRSDHASALRPPCTSTFSPACYNARRQNFMSQDQAIALLEGLAMIKLLIPTNAEVITCDGRVFKPYEIAVNIASAITNRIDNDDQNRILWPGADDKSCCKKATHIDQCAGGYAAFVIKGMKKATSYIDGAERHSNVTENISWGGLFAQSGLTNNSNEIFWLRLKTLGWEIGDDRHRQLYESTCRTRGLEMLMIMNNLLYPQQPNIDIDKNMFKQLLCSAPCGGPCRKAKWYSETTNFPNGGDPIFGDFDCPNTPRWTNQRWEDEGEASIGNHRQFNGLNYLTLFNLFMLYFPEEKENFFNPDRPENNIGFGAGKISGPDILCPVNTVNYTLLHQPANSIYDLTWRASSNIEILSQQGIGATIRVNSGTYNSFLQASFKWKVSQPQYHSGRTNYEELVFIEDPNDPEGGYYETQTKTYPHVLETCEISYRKPIVTEKPIYFEHVIAPCFTQCYAQTKGAFTPGDQVFWNITTPGGLSKIGSGDYIEFCEILDLNSGGLVTIQLNVNSVSCGNYTIEKSVLYEKCPDILPQRKIIVNPNPADNYVTFTLSRNNQPYAPPPAGANIMVNRMPMSTNYMSSTMYSSSQSFNIATLPNGVYQVTVSAQDFEPTSTTFVISR